MIIQTRWTTTERGEPLQVAVWICQDDWTALTYGYRDVGPFDDPEEVQSLLTAHLKRRAADLRVEDRPLDPDPYPQPSLFE